MICAVALPRSRLPSIATWPAGAPPRTHAPRPVPARQHPTPEQLAPHRWRGDRSRVMPIAVSVFALNRRPSARCPTGHAARQHRSNRDQQQTRQRIALTFCPPMVRHCRQRRPQAEPCHIDCSLVRSKRLFLRPDLALFWRCTRAAANPPLAAGPEPRAAPASGRAWRGPTICRGPRAPPRCGQLSWWAGQSRP